MIEACWITGGPFIQFNANSSPERLPDGGSKSGKFCSFLAIEGSTTVLGDGGTQHLFCLLHSM
jgi:hypothetical protein